MCETGKLSESRLTFLKVIRKYDIVIPIIQRDYAQGRVSEVEKRDAFLDKLREYLDADTANHDLDFVYGNLTTVNKRPVFIPLDGQQRLTTLFLLHWYLAIKDCKIKELREDFVYTESDKPKSKFSYETRTSSREFCDTLLSKDIDISKMNNLKSKTISNIITKSSWYFSTWDTDPTIQSMLNMLDSIHLKFNDAVNYYKRLADPNKEIITFQFLELNDYGLTDDLYIKMNARGKPLTEFENFKAKLEQYIEKLNLSDRYTIVNEDVLVHKYFDKMIDTDWTNLFWAHRPSENSDIDHLLMNFLKILIVNHRAEKDNFPKSLFQESGMSFSQCEKYSCLDGQFILDLIAILDMLKNGNKTVKTYIPQAFYFYDELEYFDRIINNKFDGAGYENRIVFFAYCQYLISRKGNIDPNELKHWMRIIRNLAKYTNYNREEDYLRSINAVKQLLPAKGTSILIHISNISGKDFLGFDNVQFLEEQIKACLLLRENNDWKKQIQDVEEQKYFDGQIGFLFFLSDIESYYNKNNNCKWSAEDDKEYREKFSIYSKKAKAVFDDNGVREFANHVWECALLVHGDYLLERSSNQSFLRNIQRDISWKRFLKRDRSNMSSGIIKSIFEKIKAENIEQSLIEIVELEKKESAITDWRSQFINQSDLFNYLESADRYVRKNSKQGFVLLKGERMSGNHVELYTYSLFLKYGENSFKPFSNLKYYEVASDDVSDPPRAYLEWVCNTIAYQLDICFVDNQYLLLFTDKTSIKKTYLQPIVDGLMQCNFREDINNGDIRYKTEVSSSEVIATINNLCVSLTRIS
ncbi:DUF262 domain-containing protein [Leadbettera azotonutricia]|uniref:GmrSD restriction endonucleases N-terminal domain-containing protein n=1 Tax=Leadbettera azotonutricia (strain ATCC BAA-888 / DSM 13862 / ZAS-9) TaxID=545695 RepID=F5YF47_LEAAZ|nr:DUF262 domain-containing protein [Leadbettera azotonutricia]AEF82261.1 conserved hypothetical protein [Leadbettera azotonutricia ZAS-9]